MEEEKEGGGEKPSGSQMFSAKFRPVRGEERLLRNSPFNPWLAGRLTDWLTGRQAEPRRVLPSGRGGGLSRVCSHWCGP